MTEALIKINVIFSMILIIIANLLSVLGLWDGFFSKDDKAGIGMIICAMLGGLLAFCSIPFFLITGWKSWTAYLYVIPIFNIMGAFLKWR